MLKEKNNNLKRDMSENEILKKVLTGKLNEQKTKQMWQTVTQHTQKISISTKCIIGNKKQIFSNSKHSK